MLFNSLDFFVFFIVVTTAYFALPFRQRALWLLVCSSYFYMALIPIYILVLLFTIVVDYVAGIYLEKCGDLYRRYVLLASITTNVSVLCLFKYYNFFIQNINDALPFFTSSKHLATLSIILPIGLSFHTFQAMSYTIEVYRRHVPAERNFIHYALYVMFYPQLVAGPIERPQNILPQFYRCHNFDYKRVSRGLKFILWGLFKKVVIADRLAQMIDPIYNHPQNFDDIKLAFATFFFAIQIYCDFSGYSDIALGTAEVMGIRLMRNFNRPYLSRSVSEFWKRWHISLSTWFRDYLYIPLGGNRVSPGKRIRNIMVTFAISGFWHGANWTYVVWGALNGLCLVIEAGTEAPRRKVLAWSSSIIGSAPVRFIETVFTFFLILLTWIFFRAKTIGDATYVLLQLVYLGAHFLTNPLQELTNAYRNGYAVSHPLDEIVIWCSLVFLLCTELLEERRNLLFVDWISTKPTWARWTIYNLLLLSVVVLGKMDSLQQFIYFQF